jgi:hypothetical protein
MAVFVPSLWGVVEKPVVCSDDEASVEFRIDGITIKVDRKDPGLKQLDPYRFRQSGKKALILFWQAPSNRNHIFAVYATDDVRRVAKIKKIMSLPNDPTNTTLIRLLRDQRPRYLK